MRGTLDSWKEIADFLGVSVRTALRWKERAGMPVHRAATGHVFARADELERWRRGQPAAPRPGLRLRAGLAAGLTVALAGLVLSSARSVGVPAAVRLAGSEVVAVDAGGRPRWSVTVPDLGSGAGLGWEVSTPERSLVADLDGDGEVEVVVNVLPETEGRTGRLLCFSADGSRRWERHLGRAVEDHHARYSTDYLGHLLRLVRAGERRYLLSVAAHRLWHPAQVALLDPATGEVVEEFWHPGAITHALVVEPPGGESELFLAGLNNPGPEPGNPVVMALRLPFSRSLPSPHSAFAGLSHGGPRAYAILPRGDVSVAQGAVATVTRLVLEVPPSVLVQVRYTRDKRSTLSYRFDLSLRLDAFHEAIEVPSVHGALARSGALNHVFSPEEHLWLRGVRVVDHVPDGTAGLMTPFPPAR